MRKTSGFSVIGLVAGIVIAISLGVATYFVIDGNNKATDFNSYDFYSLIFNKLSAA